MGQSQSDGDEEVELSQIQELYKKFASECPSGNLYLHEFKKIFGVSSESSAEECAYMENLFRSFDTNQDNTIDFIEYVAAVHLVLRGKLEDKLKWTFKVYDRDGNGRLDKREVRHIIRIICKVKKLNGEVESESLSPDQICNRIFDHLDVNKDGQISLEEFVEGAQKDVWILDHLKLDLKPCEWFIEMQKKSKNAKTRLKKTVVESNAKQ